MLKQILTIVKSTALISSLCVSLLSSSFIFTTTPARAGFCIDIWNPDCNIPGNPLPDVGDVLIGFQICNQRGDGNGMYFYLNGSETHLDDGYCTNFSNWPGITVMSYDMWFIDGYQGMEYNLNNGGNYYFTNISGGVGFYLR